MTDLDTAPADTATIEIIRDAWHIPHIQAATAADVVFGQGYACGIDRAWQIEFLRLRAEGRTAEIFGSDTVEWDVFARRSGMNRAARRIYTRSSPRTRELLSAYVDGINASLDTATAIEFDELEHRPTQWQPWTPIAVFIMHHILFGRFTTKLWRAHAVRSLGIDALRMFDTEAFYAHAEQPAHADPTVPPLPDEGFLQRLLTYLPDAGSAHASPADLPHGDAPSGSNAWGVAATRTATGAPIIAGDPHRFLELPGIYQQFHLATTEFDVVGFAFAGVPGVPHFAHAGTVAWGITNAMGDYQDVYIEDLTRDGEHVHARTPDGYAPADVHTEMIEIRDGASQPVEIISTDNGAVIIGGPDDGYAMSVRSPMLSDPDITFDAPLDLLFATSVSDVEEALANWSEPVNRIVIAGADGKLSCHVAGSMPARAAENYWLPVPGWESRHRWQGYATPSVSDAEFDGSVDDHAVIANQRIAGVQPLQPITTECVAPLRSARIDDLLSGDPAVTGDACERIHRDVRNEGARVFVELLESSTDLPADAAALRDRLCTWDMTMHADSTDAYLFAEFRSTLVAALTEEPILSGLRQPHGYSHIFDPWFAPQPRIAAAADSFLAVLRDLGVDLDVYVRNALVTVSTALAARDPETPWGAVHVLAPIHGFDLVGATAKHPEMSRRVRPIPHALGGDAECVQANASAVGLTHACSLGSAARYVWDLADRDAGGWVVPLGVSGHPDSPAFEDQAPAWARGALVDIISEWNILRDNAPQIDIVTRRSS